MDIKSIADALIGGDSDDILARSREEGLFLIYIVGDARLSMQYTSQRTLCQEWIDKGHPTYELALLQLCVPHVYARLVQQSLELKTHTGCTLKESVIYTCDWFCRHWQTLSSQRSQAGFWGG